MNIILKCSALGNTKLQKVKEMFSTTKLNYLILYIWMVILLVFIDFCKFLYYFDFHSSAVGSISTNQ